LKQKKPDLLSGPTGRPFLQKMFDKKKSFLKQKMQTCCLALRAGSYFLSMVDKKSEPFFVCIFCFKKLFFQSLPGIPSLRARQQVRFSEGKLTWYPFPAFFCLFLPFSAFFCLFLPFSAFFEEKG